MAVQVDDSDDFDYREGYAECVSQAANSWAFLEYSINSAIWALAKCPPALGACLTAQIVSLTGRLNALLALMKLRKVSDKLITRVNKFADSSRGPTEMRNRIVHDVWMLEDNNPKGMGQLRITAPKKLTFELQSVSLTELENDVRAIIKCRNEAMKIRRAILDEIPSLPEIPHSALHPISETPRDQ